MMEKLVLITFSLSLLLQVQESRGLTTQVRKKRSNVAMEYRLTSLETSTALIQKELSEMKSQFVEFQRVSTEMSEIASRSYEFQKYSNEVTEIKSRLNKLSRMVVQRPVYDDQLVKRYISEMMSKTLDTIQDGLANEKQHRLECENMAQETKGIMNNQIKLFEKKNRVLEKGFKKLGQTCSNICSVTTISQANTTTGPANLSTRQPSRSPKITTIPTTYTAKDCWDLKAVHDIVEDGVYDVVSPDYDHRNMRLRCDMTTDGGGWTVFQRRGDGSVQFDKTYEEYKLFFGNLTREFWMGNDFLNVFTRGVRQTLRVDICNWDNETRWTKYKYFSVGPSADNYRLGVKDYSGTAGDPLITGYKGYSVTSHNGQAFSAPGDDHDNSGGDCASELHSGWWFNSCLGANINGLYRPETSSDRTEDGIQWKTWINYHSFKGSEMKMRPSTSSSTSSSTNKPFNCPVI